METILLPKNIDISKVTFSDNVKALESGGKTIYIGYEGRPLVLQTPEMTVPFGSSCWNAGDTGKDKWSVDLSFKGMDSRSTLQAFHTFVNQLDDVIIDNALEKSPTWFKKKYTSRDVVSVLYTPLVKRSKNKDTGEFDDKYPPTFKLNLPFKDGKFDIDIYSALREQMTLSSIEKGSKVTAIIQCIGLWIAGGKFGCSWKVVQLRVVKPETIQGFAFKDDEEGDADARHVNVRNEDDDVDVDVDVELASSNAVTPPLPPAAEMVESSDDEEVVVAPPPKKGGKGKAAAKK